jgi:hypothetical protein
VSFFSFSNASIIEAGAVGILFGAYFGVVSLYDSGNLFQPLDINNLWAIVLKFSVGLPLLLPFVIPAVFVIGTTNAYLAALFYTVIPTTGTGFVLYGFMDRMADYLCGGAKLASRRQKD